MNRDSGAALYEFFAGGGMARLGLEPAFETRFANDRDPAKCAQYERAFGAAVLRPGDVTDLATADLPGRAALAWASFPCQDLSLAGARGGLSAPRSGAFWGFWRLMEGLIAEGRAPRVLALENVAGLFTSRGGADFAALMETLTRAGYAVGALEIDASAFVPQSRPRAFVVAVQGEAPAGLRLPGPSGPFHSKAARTAVERLPEPLRAKAVWWRLAAPPLRNARLADVIEDDACVGCWNGEAKTERLLALMSARQRTRLAALQASGGRHVGTLFRRIRRENGAKVQRAEARFDGLAGCLRTPAGGSSLQTLVVVEDGVVRTRLVTPREAARLMGLPDEYPLPKSRTAALHLLGDGVAVPAVRWLGQELLAPLAGLRPTLRR